MTRGVSRWIVPLELPTHTLDRERVMRACQALSLDEARTTFHPELWDEKIVLPSEFDPDKKRHIADEQISQVWFAGVHSNVGGGYPDDALAYIPLVWMLTEAQRCGLKLKSDVGDPPADPDALKNAISMGDKDGRIYDPRAGLGGYYRYGPRKLVQLCNYKYSKKEDDEVTIERPKIHETVFRRIGNHAHAYAPIGLPATYDIVKSNGEIVTPDQYGFETGDAAKVRADAQEHIWNEIWKRRIVYFATVGVTAWLLAFPLISGAQRADEFKSPVRWISDIIRLVGAFLPGFASTWVDGYARAPIPFVLLALLVASFTIWGMTIAARISDRMGAIWLKTPGASSGLPDDGIYRLRSNRIYIWFHEGLKRRWAPALFALLFVYLGLSLLSHGLYDIQDLAGLTCVESTDAKKLEKPEWSDKAKDKDGQPVIATATASFEISELCNPTKILLEKGVRYHLEIDAPDSWKDGGIRVPVGGFSASDPPPWYHRILLGLLVPLRRELTQDWFRIVLRYGRVGGEEVFLDPDPEDSKIETNIRPTRDGELFIFVNDAVIGIPGLYDFFYRNNGGNGKLTLTRKY
jgi:type VI secretion system (T6SS) phospholipase Tle1-like effector